jgi:DNA-binding transcriptional LysR family regulator
MRRLGFTEGVDSLLAGDVDVAFLPEPLPSMPKRLSKTPISTEPRVLVVPATHRLARRRSVRISETDDDVFIAAAGPAEIVNWWIVDPRPNGGSPRRGPHAGSVEEMLELCAAGLGVNIAAASVGTFNNRPDLRFIPVSDIPPAEIALVRLADSPRPDVAAFERVALAVATRQ